MDLYLLIGIATALLVILITLFIFQKKSPGKSKQPQPQRVVPVRVRAPEGIPRRAQIARNQRNRLRNNAPIDELSEVIQADATNNASDSDDKPSTTSIQPDEKMGAKKRAKMEAKEHKRQQREQELKLREEKKAKEIELEEERKKLEKKEVEETRKREEIERLAREERERKEHEEYMKLKETFSIDEEGFDEDDDEKENLLADFIQYIKDNKVVVLEDVATEFKLKTQQAIDRITELQTNGTITGVIDDRGKFIYVSEEELLDVAKFIKQRGRVSITELAENSNKLINLNPIVSS